MSDASSTTDASAPPHARRPTAEHASYPGMPLWVKVFGLVAILLVLLFVGLHLLGGFGPGSHTPVGAH